MVRIRRTTSPIRGAEATRKAEGREDRKSKVRERRYNLNLGRHLTVCDGNYLRLTKLMPNLGRHARDVGIAGDRRAFRVIVGATSPAVTIEVLECSRYTTVLGLCQRSGGRGIADLRMRVRLYHDARSAEVIEFQGKRRFESAYLYPNPEMRQPDEKAQVNRFLSEFLNACLRHGVAAESTLGCGADVAHRPDVRPQAPQSRETVDS